MKSEREILGKAIERALSGEGAHVEAKNVFEGLDWKVAGSKPEGAPHSLFQLLNHLIYWQNWVNNWLDGKEPPTPSRASGSWPGGTSPANAKEWERTVKTFLRGLDALDARSRKGDPFTRQGQKSRLEMLHIIASHNSYHLGQAVVIRQMLGTWPPPSGGLTW